VVTRAYDHHCPGNSGHVLRLRQFPSEGGAKGKNADLAVGGRFIIRRS